MNITAMNFLKLFKPVVDCYDKLERKALQKSAEKRLEQELTDFEMQKKMSVEEIYKTIKEEKQKARKSVMYKTFSVSEIRRSVLRQIIGPAMQGQVERWWFGLNASEREEIYNDITDTFRGKFIKNSLKQGIAEEDNDDFLTKIFHSINRGIIHYWPVMVMFVLMFVCFAINVILQSPFIAMIGVILSLIILWQCKIIKTNKVLNLKYFCPFTIMFLYWEYLKHIENNKGEFHVTNSNK